MSGSVLGAQSFEAEVYADVPKIDVNVSQAINVTSDCKPASPDTLADLVFHNLTQVVPTLSYDWGYNVTDFGSHNIPIGNGTPLATSCLDYLPSATALGKAPSRSKSTAAFANTSTSASAACASLVIAIILCILSV